VGPVVCKKKKDARTAKEKGKLYRTKRGALSTAYALGPGKARVSKVDRQFPSKRKDRCRRFPHSAGENMVEAKFREQWAGKKIRPRKLRGPEW